MRVCLDAWAVIAWMEDEVAAESVDAVLNPAREGAHGPIIAALNLGEVYYRLWRARGEATADRLWTESVEGRAAWAIVPPTIPRVLAAARLKARFPVSFADAFAMATAAEHRCSLVTGDREIRAVHEEAGVELMWLGPSSSRGAR